MTHMTDRTRRTTARFVTAVACSSLIGLVTACGSSSASKQSNASDKQTITIVNWLNPPANAAIRQINTEFEQKYRNIKVKYVVATDTSTQYPTVLQTAVSSNSADIITTPSTFQPLPLNPTRENMAPAQLWATSGLIEPLSGQPWLKNLSQAALQDETYKGKVYGVLSGQYQYMVFYDKAVFQKYHLTPPATYDQFLTLCKTLKSHGVTPLWTATGGSNSVGLQWYMLDPLMSSDWAATAANGNLASALESGSAKWDDAPSVDVLGKLATIGKYLEPGYTGIPWQGMPGDFAAHKAAMLLDGSYDLATVHKANPSMKIGSFPLPGSNDASKNTSILTNDLTFEVLSHSQHKAAAMKWLEFFTQPDIYKQYVDATGISPSEVGGSYDSFAATVLGSYFGKGTNANTVFPALSASQGFYTQTSKFPALLVDVIGGTKSPTQAAKLYASSWKTSS
jgi:raffinose/stachyose/melibiose transport system substrate-binding protein